MNRITGSILLGSFIKLLINKIITTPPKSIKLKTVIPTFHALEESRCHGKRYFEKPRGDGKDDRNNASLWNKSFS